LIATSDVLLRRIPLGTRWALLRVAAVVCLAWIGALMGHAQVSWPLWEAYSRTTIDSQGRVIDHSAQDRSTSEGQAYAMFFALVDNDRAHFDLLLHWTEQNLAGGDLSQRLPAWSWGKRPDGSWGVTDPNPASDADLWMAYALSEAGRLWHVPRYQNLGMALVVRIGQEEVAYIPGLGTSLLPGPTGFHPTSTTWILNPSYLPPPLLAYFATNMPLGPWKAVLESVEPLLAKGSPNGFAMDWVVAGQGISASATPAQIAAGDTQALPIGSYDAIRVYLWLGLSDPQMPELRSYLSDVLGMAEYLKTNPIPPEKVDSKGRIVSPNGPPGFSAAVVPYLSALGAGAQMKAQMDRLASTRNSTNGLYGKDGAYYDQNLSLFATGWIEQRYRFDRNGKLQARWK
jgi:endoglucanase